MSKTKKILIGIILIAVLLLGVGYAAIQNVTLNIVGTAKAGPSQSNFVVKFTGTPEVSDSSKAMATITDDTNATINVEGLTSRGETVTARYILQNASTDLSADLTVEITNSNEEYFVIESELEKINIVAGEVTTLTVTVELIKTPILTEETSVIGIQLIAEPVQLGEEGRDSNVGGEVEEDDIVKTSKLNLTGTINSSKFEFSLDGINWTNSLVIGTNDGEFDIIEDAYEGHCNISPVQMVPVSTSGEFESGINQIKMLRGELINSRELQNIVTMDESLAMNSDKTNHDPTNERYPGYYAFDLFVKNPSKIDNIIPDTVQLNYDSAVRINGVYNDVTGLQNAVRIGFARYGENVENGGKIAGVADVNADQRTVLNATGAVAGGDYVYITDVAIWEPNSNSHTKYIVENNNKITWNTKEELLYAHEILEDGISRGFGETTQIPTYSLKNAALGQTINDVYWWDLDGNYGVTASNPKGYSNKNVLTKQKTLQTTKTSDQDYTIKEGVQNLITTASTKEGDNENFEIASNSITRMRVYIWLEAQDVDVIDYKQYDGNVIVNIGLEKGRMIGEKYIEEE